jgi:heterodisulfide reductase subunit A
MQIQTHSERVLKIRRILAELMLARCPESEVLRDLARQLGVAHCRFERPRGETSPCPTCGACTLVERMRLRAREGAPSTFVGKGGCILCGMCVRVCDDVMQIGALTFEGRGMRRHVTTPFRKPSEFCITCGACSSICPTGAIELMRIRAQPPVPIPSEFDCGLANRKPIYLPFLQAVPRVPVIDKDTCVYFQTGGCKVCEDNCQVQAIDHSMQDRVEEIEVGTITIATGFQAFDPSVIPYYGYGKYPNVYTSLEVERLVNAGGPTSGKLVLRDGSTPKRVGIIHCVGSRDANYHAYCSRVCCMYALKLAHLVREKTEAEVYNCYIDIRTPGKGFEEFYNRVQNEGVHFIRGKVADITRAQGNGAAAEGRLTMTVDDTLLGTIRKLDVDMVILAIALEPQADANDVRRAFGISCSAEGFFLEKHPKLAPVNTANDGVFLAGACQGAKDIPDTVAQADAAAAKALALIDAGQIELEPNTAWIDEDMCSGCKTCIPLCPYKAISRDEERAIAVIDQALCKGCGTCVAACPSGAAMQHLFSDEQVHAELEGLMTYV